MVCARWLVMILAAQTFGACALGGGTLVDVGSYSRSYGSGSPTCSNSSGQRAVCDGGSYVYDPITTPGGTYQSGGSLGVQFGARRGWHSSSSGDRTAKGTAFDLAIELMMNSGRLGYSFELGYTRKDLSDFGGEGDRSTAFSLIPRIQLNSGRVGLYAGLGYLAFGFYDLPSGFGTEAGGYRAVGGVRAGLPLGLPLLNGVVVTVELQHEATLGDADFSSNAIVGGITAIVF